MAVVFFVDMSRFRHACAKAFTVSRVCLFSSVIEMFVTSTVATNKCWLGRLGIVFPKFIANSNSIKPIPSPLYNVCVQSSPIQSNLTLSIYLASYLFFFFLIMLGAWDYTASSTRLPSMPTQSEASELQVQHGLNARIPHEVLLRERERGRERDYILIF